MSVKSPCLVLVVAWMFILYTYIKRFILIKNINWFGGLFFPRQTSMQLTCMMPFFCMPMPSMIH